MGALQLIYYITLTTFCPSYRDTLNLSQLIDERDVILNSLEMAEIQYINSFRLSTPASSINDLEIPEEISEAGPATTSLKQQISGPKALHGHSVSETLIFAMFVPSYEYCSEREHVTLRNVMSMATLRQLLTLHHLPITNFVTCGE